MSTTKIALLEDRGVVAVTGEDAEKLLQGVITNDMDDIAKAGALHAALLTPQGKILFEFLIVPDGEGGFLLDTARAKAGDLVKRLTMYRLRAKAAITDRSEAIAVLAAWDGKPTGAAETLVVPDPRAPALGHRVLTARHMLAMIADATEAAMVPAADYHAHRIAVGFPEAGHDYALGDTFPHEAGMDLYNGVSFSKGCFVGQEVVARMQHKTVVRKRAVGVTGTGALASGAEVLAGAANIGTIGSVAGSRGMALLRLDRVAEALDKGEAITAGGVSLTVDAGALSRYRAAVSARAATP